MECPVLLHYLVAIAKAVLLDEIVGLGLRHEEGALGAVHALDGLFLLFRVNSGIRACGLCAVSYVIGSNLLANHKPRRPRPDLTGRHHLMRRAHAAPRQLGIGRRLRSKHSSILAGDDIEQRIFGVLLGVGRALLAGRVKVVTVNARRARLAVLGERAQKRLIAGKIGCAHRHALAANVLDRGQPVGYCASGRLSGGVRCHWNSASASDSRCVHGRSGSTSVRQASIHACSSVSTPALTASCRLLSPNVSSCAIGQPSGLNTGAAGSGNTLGGGCIARFSSALRS